MAKKTDKQVPEVLVDKTPEQALAEDWPAKHEQLAPFITKTGRMRTGLKPSAQARAREILAGYGFGG